MSHHHHALHRSAPSRRTRRRRTARLAGLLTAASLGVTGLAVGGGVLLQSLPTAGSDEYSTVALSASHPLRELTEAELAERDADRLSRSAQRVPAAAELSKANSLSNASGPARTGVEDLSNADPRTLAKALMPQFGMSASEFDCLDAVWSQESGWNVHADNPTSSAYGIPQALPGSKMASAGPDWENNPITQIKWGLGYIKARYGSACGAADFKSGNGWY